MWQDLQTERLRILRFTPDMAAAVSRLSKDADNRRFLPDEVFETEADALAAITELRLCYAQPNAPQVYPMQLLDGTQIGHVEAVPLQDGWELGYHIGADYTGRGYATEALKAFLPFVFESLGIDQMRGVCLAENPASCRVLEKLGFRLAYAREGLYQGELRQLHSYIFDKGQPPTA